MDRTERFYKIQAMLMARPSVTIKQMQDTLEVAKLKLTPFRAQWVAREIWHPEQIGQVHADSRYTLEVPYGEDWELIQDILRQGSDVEVLSPPALKVKVKETIQKMLELY
jgi:predicted DNA-binding transcriptional regulator YafY